jgi:hypothetical protein
VRTWLTRRGEPNANEPDRAAAGQAEYRSADERQESWFITGAGRGIGLEISKAALAAGNAVVATGRDVRNVANAIGERRDLLVTRLT